ncbi:hypothetical protein ACFQ1I_20075 [Kitasatospora arboriphila]
MTMKSTATSSVPIFPTRACIAAALSATAEVTSQKHGSSGQKWLLEYAPIPRPAIRSVSSAPTSAYPIRMAARHGAAATPWAAL